jgi:hypothetical protein
VLQPKQVGTVEVVFDTRRFQGRRFQVVYLVTDNGDRLVTRFTVIADSQDVPLP